MPPTRVLFFMEQKGVVPVLDWILHFDPPVQIKLYGYISRLAQFGHELRRPSADYLRDGTHELRIRHGRLHYRILYFFHGRNIAVIGNGLVKESAVPAAEIDRALKRKAAFEQNPAAHFLRSEIIMKKTSKTSDALEILDHLIFKNHPERRAALEIVRQEAEIAQQIYYLRQKAGLSQRDLARKIGTTASVICRLEDADYNGRSLSMLHKIATALDQRIEVRFVPNTRPRRPAPTRRTDKTSRSIAAR